MLAAHAEGTGIVVMSDWKSGGHMSFLGMKSGKQIAISAVSALLACPILAYQGPAQTGTTFEVASVKPVRPGLLDPAVTGCRAAPVPMTLDESLFARSR